MIMGNSFLKSSKTTETTKQITHTSFPLKEEIIWLFDREIMWGFMVFIGKSKGLSWGCIEEGKDRN